MLDDRLLETIPARLRCYALLGACVHRASLFRPGCAVLAVRIIRTVNARQNPET